MKAQEPGETKQVGVVWDRIDFLSDQISQLQWKAQSAIEHGESERSNPKTLAGLQAANRVTGSP